MSRFAQSTKSCSAAQDQSQTQTDCSSDERLLPQANPSLFASLVKSQPSFIALLGLGVVFLLSLWFLIDVWLIVFAAILVAIFVVGLADGLKAIPIIGVWFAKKSHAVAVFAVLFLLVLAMTVLVLLFGHELVSQFGAMKEALPEALNQLKSYAATMPLLSEWLGEQAIFKDGDTKAIKSLFMSVVDTISISPSMIGSVLGGITTFVAIVLIGVFFALSPQIYVRGFLRMIAPSHRSKGSYLLTRSYTALRRWLIGQFVVMAFVGISTAIGLYLMGIPFALALGFLAFLLDFIPVLGPWLAAVPLILITLLFAPNMLVWAVVLVIVVQQLESYVVAPMVQHKLVSLPPVALLLSQIIMGTLTGFLGIALATPLVVALIVWVQILYVKFVLGDYQIVIMGQSDAELKDDPFNALPKGDVYADDMVIDSHKIDTKKLGSASSK